MILDRTYKLLYIVCGECECHYYKLEIVRKIYKKISIYAKKQHRTIAQQVISLLEKGLKMEQPNIERRKILLEKINSRNIKNEVNLIDDAALIREDRDR